MSVGWLVGRLARNFCEMAEREASKEKQDGGRDMSKQTRWWEELQHLHSCFTGGGEYDEGLA